MLKKGLIILATVTLLLFPVDHLLGQVTPQPFVIRDSNGTTNDIDHFIIKGDNKTYQFKMDTSSIDYKSLSQIDPNWIKAIEILKNKPVEGEAKTFVIITLKKRKLNKLSGDLRNKFH